jgi:hypothetical protein
MPCVRKYLYRIPGRVLTVSSVYGLSFPIFPGELQYWPRPASSPFPHPRSVTATSRLTGRYVVPVVNIPDRYQYTCIFEVFSPNFHPVANSNDSLWGLRSLWKLVYKIGVILSVQHWVTCRPIYKDLISYAPTHI